MRSKSFEKVKNVFGEFGIDCFEKEDRIILFNISGYNAKYICSVSVKPFGKGNSNIITMVSSSSEIVSSEKRPVMLELLNEFNSNISVGNFFVDFELTVSFRTSIQVPEDQLTPEIISDLLCSNMIIMDVSYPKIAEIIRGDVNSSTDKQLDISQIPDFEMSVI